MRSSSYKPRTGSKGHVSLHRGLTRLYGIWRPSPGFLEPCASMGSFVGFYSLCYMLTSTLSPYLSSQFTTLEKQFGLSSSQTALLLSGNDIGFQMSVLTVSYLATRLHIPRALGFTTFVFGLCGLLCSLPQFLFGADLGPGENVTLLSPSHPKGLTVYGDMCTADNSSQVTCLPGSGQRSTSIRSVVSDHVTTISVAMIFSGMILQGLCKGARNPLCVLYVDNNSPKEETGFHLGIIMGMGILGPGLAFTAGGVFSRIYVTLGETNLHPKHPKWIGAWWLGFLMLGCLSLIVSLPLFCFPRSFTQSGPHARKNKGLDTGLPTGTDIAAGHKQDVDLNEPRLNSTKDPAEEPQKHTKTSGRFNFVLANLKDVLLTLCRLWTNPIYMLTIVSTCFTLFAVAGILAYTPKYIETMFSLTASTANYIMAIQLIASTCLGTFIGGYITKRLRMSPKMALSTIIILQIISLGFTILGFVFACDQKPVHNWPGSTSSCNTGCNCEDKYYPVCGKDEKTYYSPCHAGCDQVEQGVYKNCTCVSGGEAIPGTCDQGCSSIYPYVIVMSLRSLFSGISIMPKLIIYIRTVAEKDKAVAVGLQSFTSSLLGWLLGPIIIGRVIDGMCVIWDVKCGVTGRCLLYDNDLFRLKLHGYCVVALGCSLACSLVALVYAMWSKVLDDPKRQTTGLALLGETKTHDAAENDHPGDATIP